MEPKFNDVYLINNLPKIEIGSYVINLDEYKSIRTHSWLCIRTMVKQHTFADSCLNILQKKLKKFIGNKNIIGNIYRIQEDNSTMYENFCIGSIDFMLKDRRLLDYTNYFFPKKYKKRR